MCRIDYKESETHQQIDVDTIHFLFDEMYGYAGQRMRGYSVEQLKLEDEFDKEMRG